MAKFMLLYNSDMTIRDVMASTNAEQIDLSIKNWLEWREAASKLFKVEFGLPLQPIERVTSKGEIPSETRVTGYTIVEGESKKALMKLLKTHPHLKRPNASIDVLEMQPVPGLDS